MNMDCSESGRVCVKFVLNFRGETVIPHSGKAPIPTAACPCSGRRDRVWGTVCFCLLKKMEPPAGLTRQAAGFVCSWRRVHLKGQGGQHFGNTDLIFCRSAGMPVLFCQWVTRNITVNSPPITQVPPFSSFPFPENTAMRIWEITPKAIP